MIWVVAALWIVLTGCGASQESIPEPTVTSTADLPTEEMIVVETAAAPTEIVTPTEPLVQEPEPVAERIIDGFRVDVDGKSYDFWFSDGDHYSRKSIDPMQQLRLTSETPFGGIYIIWDQVPGTYSLCWEGGSMECGAEGFLHDYIRLPEPVQEVWFEFHDEESKIICDLFAFTAGVAPEGIQDWEPPCENADILVFPTHSDDDVLFFGPLIIYYSIERDLKVQTAFMVDHRAFPERGHERLNALWEMGVRYYPVLGTAPDTEIHDFEHCLWFYEASDIPRWQVEQIRRFQPLVIVGHDLDGEYGNGGHKVNAYYLTQSVEWASDPEMYPESAEKYGTWDAPKLYLHCYPENSWMLDVNTPLTGDSEGRTAFEIAEDAFLYHVSQYKWSFRMTQDGSKPSNDCRPFGLYRSLVGLDTTADVMDNIDPERWRGGPVG